MTIEARNLGSGGKRVKPPAGDGGPGLKRSSSKASDDRV